MRRALPADLDDLLALVAEFCAIDAHPYDDARVRPALLALLVDDTFGQVWVVDGDDDLVAYAIVTWSYSLESGGRDCILDEIYVRDRSHGLGGALVEHAQREAALAGARVMALETERPNARARAFYERHGFVEEDSIWMLTELS